MTEIIGQTKLSVKELAAKCNISYGYMRGIVAGTVLPNRNALTQLCDGLGLDFAHEWRKTHPMIEGPVERSITDEILQHEADLLAADNSETMPHKIDRKVIDLMSEMPVDDKLELLHEAYRLYFKSERIRRS